MGRLFWIACLLVATPAAAQESQIHADFRAEGEHLKENCSAFDLAKIGACAMTLATDHPLHLAFGNIAPQNGFGLGVALVGHHTPNERWRATWNADAVGAPGGAWRTGAYFKIIHTPVSAPTVIPASAAGSATSTGGIRAYAVVDAYAQTISLPTLLFFGLGPGTSRDGKAAFGMRETVIGTRTVVPIARFEALRGINLAALGEVNGRFVQLRRATSTTSASLFDRYSESTAPGLSAQPSFVQFGEGIRISPLAAAAAVRLNYQVDVEQFRAPADATSSFRRWTITLDHEIGLYHRAPARRSLETNGPDDCAIDPTTARCPSVSRDRTGAIGIKMTLSKSDAAAGSRVPFYFQPTLGGSDINGVAALAGYDDYRFRGPHLLLLQETFEHSIYGPVGVWLAAEQGKVARQPTGIFNTRDFVQSVAGGVSLRAGGFPAIVLSLARGTEGYHFAATISPTLLGGSARPSLH